MSSISQKLKVTALALVSFLMRGCSDIPQSAGDNWTELCKARLDKSMCQADSQCLWVEKDDEPSRCHAAQRWCAACVEPALPQRIKHEKPRGSHSYRGSASHYATPSNGVGFVWIAFLMPHGGSWPHFGLD